MSEQMPPVPENDPTAAPPPPGEVPSPPIEATPEAVPTYPPAEAAPAAPPPGAPAYPPADAAPTAWPAAYPPPGAPAAPPPGAPAYPPPAETSSNAIIALILAIVSWAVCPIIPAIVALVLASMANKEIAASNGRIQGTGLVTAARIVSWVNIGVWAAAAVVGVFFLVLAIVAGSMDGVN